MKIYSVMLLLSFNMHKIRISLQHLLAGLFDHLYCSVGEATPLHARGLQFKLSLGHWKF